jgi:hypothetical protein
MAAIYLLLLSEQNKAINPSILRHNLVNKSQISEITEWTVEFFRCGSQEPRNCVEYDRHAPAFEGLHALDAFARKK